MNHNKHRRTFLALHGRNERILARRIVTAIRGDVLLLKGINIYNYKSVLSGMPLENLEAEIMSGWVRAGQMGAMVYRSLEAEKKYRNPFFSEFWNNWIVSNSAYLIGNKIKTIQETLLADLSGLISQTIEANADLFDITTVVHNFVKEPEFYRWQAMRIARTETTTAMNTAMDVAAEQTGIMIEKVWIASIDDRTRDSHADLDGVQVPKNEPFRTSNGNSLDYPGDPNGRPEEIINCRCTVGYVPVRDNTGNLILN